MEKILETSRLYLRRLEVTDAMRMSCLLYTSRCV